MPNHRLLTNLSLHDPFHYIQETDPGAVGAGIYWLKLSLTTLYRRNDSNTSWDTVFYPALRRGSYQVLTDGATVTITCDSQSDIQNATITLGGNRTLAISGAVAGMYGTLVVKQDATGSRTLTLPASSKVINGGAGAITLTTTANGIDVLTWFYSGATYYWNYGKNYS